VMGRPPSARFCPRLNLRSFDVKIVFIAGAYTASSETTTIEHISTAEKYAKSLAKNEIGFVCPHTNSGYMHDLAPREFWYKMYLELLVCCDAVLALPNWQKSVGATAEVAKARREHIKVFESLPELIKWAKRRKK
jgi:hypothetical protein